MLMTIPNNLISSRQYTSTRQPPKNRVHLHETYNGAHFDDGKDELGLTKAFDAAQVDTHDDGQEEGDEEGLIYRIVPV